MESRIAYRYEKHVTISLTFVSLFMFKFNISQQSAHSTILFMRWLLGRDILAQKVGDSQRETCVGLYVLVTHYQKEMHAACVIHVTQHSISITTVRIIANYVTRIILYFLVYVFIRFHVVIVLHITGYLDGLDLNMVPLVFPFVQIVKIRLHISNTKLTEEATSN